MKIEMGRGIDIGSPAGLVPVVQVQMRRRVERDHATLVVHLVRDAGTVERPGDRARQHRDEQHKHDRTFGKFAHDTNYACRRPAA